MDWGLVLCPNFFQFLNSSIRNSPIDPAMPDQVDICEKSAI